MARSGEHDRVIEIISVIAVPAEKAKALASVAEVLAPGNREVAMGLLAGAESITRSDLERYDRIRVLRLIARATAKVGEHGCAAVIARDIDNTVQKVLALVSVAEVVAETGEPERAMALLVEAGEVMKSIEDSNSETWPLESVATAMVEVGGHERASALARSIADPVLQARILKSIAETIEPDQKPGLIVRQLQRQPWYRASPELFPLATEAFNDGVAELCGRSNMPRALN
jgi:hypothetical protein